MKHLFKVEDTEDGVLITLAIKLTRSEELDIARTSNDPYVSYSSDLVKGYKKNGLEWLLHLLRLYVFFVGLPCTFKDTVDSSKKKRKKRRKKKK